MDTININKAELLNRLEQLKKQQEGLSAEIQDLSGMIQNLPEKVPEQDYLNFNDGEKCWIVDYDGTISEGYYDDEPLEFSLLRHRLFKSERMAKLFAEKTQFIADCLFWKERYDSNYVPDWNNISIMDWVVVFDHARGKYEVVGYSTWDFGNVCFSSEEIAQDLADWLNRKRDEK